MAVERDLSVLGAGVLMPVVDELAAGTARSVPQDDTLATYAHRLEKTEGPLDWAWPAEVVHNRVRGLQPWPMAWTFLHGTRLIVVQTRRVAGDPAPQAEPGTILAVSKDGIRVQTGTGALDLTLVQPEGRRPMTARDFAAGHRLQPGTRLTGPVADGV